MTDTELEQLRRWKAEAAEVLTRWEDVWQALGRPGPLGRPKSEGVLAEVTRLREVLAAVASLELKLNGDPDYLVTQGSLSRRLHAVLADHADTRANVQADQPIRLTSDPQRVVPCPHDCGWSGPLADFHQHRSACEVRRTKFPRTTEGTDHG